MSIIITFITQASPRCVQELGTFLAPQNRTQGRGEGQMAVRHYANLTNPTIAFIDFQPEEVLVRAFSMIVKSSRTFV